MGRAQSWSQKTVAAAVILLQPALLLIDHGHFQYNNVCLGFTALAIALLWKDQEFLASIAFSLALNFKQMALYYAPAVGVYLLSKCIYRANTVLHVVKLGVAVLLTFGVLWIPFCAFPHEDESCFSSVGQVVHRIFPFARGLFEDKVANVWCVLDLVVKLKRRVAPALQMRLCTISTLIGFLPSIIDLLRRKPTRFRFLLALANSSLSFFLFSFQVHEKTILLPLLPISLLYAWAPLLSTWFSFVSTFSMYFLLKKDGLIIPYIVLQALFFFAAVRPALSSTAQTVTNLAPGHDAQGRPSSVLQYFALLSTVGTIVIHVAQATITAPVQYPHIFDYLFAAYSCGHFLLALAYCTYWQWTTAGTEPVSAKKKTTQKQKHE